MHLSEVPNFRTGYDRLKITVIISQQDRATLQVDDSTTALTLYKVADNHWLGGQARDVQHPNQQTAAQARKSRDI